ncbi:MAG: hypothetical protein QXI33_02010 [Candidatus Pacearchaeota archaeon]
MVNVYVTPDWFFIYSILFELSFAFISVLVAVYSFKLYFITKEKELGYFGIGFSFISLSYLFWAAINTFLLDTLTKEIRVLDLKEFMTIGNFGIYIYMVLFIIGLATLTYTALKVNNNKVYSLLLIISVLIILSSYNKAFYFQILSSIFLIFLIAHYYSQFNKDKTYKRVIILIAFILLLLSRTQFILSTSQYIYYVIGHFLELIAYSLILLRLILILRK